MRRAIRASIGNRAKEGLVVDFIQQTNLDPIGDKASVIEAFFTFAQAKLQREAQALIDEENLNAAAANRYISTSLKCEFASDNGTELNAVLPKMSPLNPQYLTKKQTVFQKIAALWRNLKGWAGRFKAVSPNRPGWGSPGVRRLCSRTRAFAGCVAWPAWRRCVR